MHLLPFSCSVMSDALRPHGLQHARLSCPSTSPGACSNPCPSSRWCHPTILSSRSFLFLPSIFPSIRVFFNESALHIRWPKDWSFSFSPSNEYSGLISFRMDWLDLLAVQGTLKSLLQHHNSKASILRHSAFFIFFMVQLSQVVNFLTKILPLWSTLVFIMHNKIWDHPLSNCSYKNGHLVNNYKIETLTSTVWKFLNTKERL